METTKHIFKVDRREINYLRVTIESYDGMALVKTIDPQSALIELVTNLPWMRAFSIRIIEKFERT